MRSIRKSFPPEFMATLAVSDNRPGRGVLTRWTRGRGCTGATENANRPGLEGRMIRRGLTTRLRSELLPGPADFHLPFRPLRGWSVCLGQRVVLLLPALSPGPAGVGIWALAPVGPGAERRGTFAGEPDRRRLLSRQGPLHSVDLRLGRTLYVIAHTIIAFVGLIALCRSFGVTWVGSFLGGLSYAFGRRSCSCIATSSFW